LDLQPDSGLENYSSPHRLENYEEEEEII